MKGARYMSEEEKNIIIKFALTLLKLSKDKQSYILGVAEGMAIAKEDNADSGKKKELQEV